MTADVSRATRMVAARIQFGGGAVPPVSIVERGNVVPGVGVGWTPNLAGAIVVGSSDRLAHSLKPSVWSVNAVLVNTAMSLESSWGNLTMLTMSIRLRNCIGNGTQAWMGSLNEYCCNGVP